MRITNLSAVALLLASGTALAQMPPPHRWENGDVALKNDHAGDGPGNGLQLELNVFRQSTTYSTDAIFSIAASVAGSGSFGLLSTLQPLVLVGYQGDGNAILLGVGVASIGGNNGSGGVTFFGISPTYRRYLSPLRTSRISAFVEGGVTFSVSIPGGQSAPPASWGLGIDVGGGAEWLFVRNFGLFAKALLAYGHVNLVSGGGGSSTTTNIDGLGLEGDVGLSVHF